MKVIILFICISFGLVTAQNKDQNYIQLNLESCRIPLNDSISLYIIHENLYNNEVDIIIKTENIIIQECRNETINDELISKIKKNENASFKINQFSIKDIDIKDFKNVIPNKVCAIKKPKYITLLVELYSFSYSTVGTTYIDFCFKIDNNGNIVDKRKIESKSSIKINRLNKIF